MVFILILAIFLKPVFPVIEYIVNYDYISTVLCENKAQPIMQCNGKCHLMKELAKAADAEKPSSSDKKNTLLDKVDLMFESTNAFVLQFYPNNTKSKINAAYANLYSHLNADLFFHPPARIS